MTEKVLKLLAAMGADTSQEELLTPLCQAVQGLPHPAAEAGGGGGGL